MAVIPTELLGRSFSIYALYCNIKCAKSQGICGLSIMINIQKFGIRAAVLCLTMWLPERALSFSGNDLYAELQKGSPSDIFVVGYVVGISRMAMIFGYQGECIKMPNEGTARQSTDVVKAYLRDRPDQRHMDATLLVLLALKKAFGSSPVDSSGWCK